MKNGFGKHFNHFYLTHCITFINLKICKDFTLLCCIVACCQYVYAAYLLYNYYIVRLEVLARSFCCRSNDDWFIFFILANLFILKVKNVENNFSGVAVFDFK